MYFQGCLFQINLFSDESRILCKLKKKLQKLDLFSSFNVFSRIKVFISNLKVFIFQ